MYNIYTHIHVALYMYVSVHTHIHIYIIPVFLDTLTDTGTLEF